MGAGLRIKGLIVGLAGTGLLAWALFTLFTFGACSEVPGAACSDPGATAALAIPGGIILGIIGIFMGGGFLVFAAMFLAVGLSALVPAVLGMMGSMTGFGWIFGGAFVLGGLLPLLMGLNLKRAVARKQALASELMRSGAKGVGTIVEVRDTGVTINENPTIVIRMGIEPVDGGPAVERSKTVTVSRVAIPRAGDRHPVWFDRSDPEKWMFGVDMDETAPAEVREMFARARAAGPEGHGEGGADGPVEELETLTRLWREGALTDREFADAKARLLPRIGR